MTEEVLWIPERRIFGNADRVNLIINSKNKVKFYAVTVSETGFGSPRRIPPPGIDGFLHTHSEVLGADISALLLPSTVKLALAIILQASPPSKIISDLESIGYRNTVELEKWFDGQPIKEVIEFVHIISKPCRNSRQRSLQKLVEFKTTTSEILLILLATLRNELTNSIYREIGRQGRQIPQLIERAKHDTQDISSELSYFAFLYLMSMKSDDIIDHHYMNYLRLETQFLLNMSKKEIFSKNTMHLQAGGAQTSRTYAGFIHLSEAHPQRFSDLISSFYSRPPIKKELIHGNRSAIIFLLKHAEAAANASLLGGILCLATINFTKVSGTHPEKGMMLRGSMYFTNLYVIRRSIRLMRLWEQTNRAHLVKEALVFYITHIPPQPIENDEHTITETISNHWFQFHPILSKYHKEVSSIIKDDIEILLVIIRATVKNSNLLFFNWILHQINTSILQQVMDVADSNDILWLYTSNHGNPTLQEYIIERLQSNDLKIEENYDYIPSSIFDIPNVLDFFTQIGTLMPPNLFQYVIVSIFNGQYTDVPSVLKYLSSFRTPTAKKRLPLYFEIINKIVKDRLVHSMKNRYVIDFVDSIVINWVKITQTRLFLQDEFAIDTYRILLIENLTENKPEIWDLLSVEAITLSFKMMRREIHPFIETHLQSALNKPNWDQMARYYLALGIQRPSNDALRKSQLRKIPSRLLQDILGQLALVNETIKYCERNGFTPVFESVIIQNIYKRGWNIEQRLEKSLYSLLGNVSPKLRSYIAAYFILEKGEFTREMLVFGREVDNYQIREKILRSLSRFGTADMWLIVAESSFDDISDEAIENLKKSRISKEERNHIISRLIKSSLPKLQTLGLQWLQDYENFEMLYSSLVLSDVPNVWKMTMEFALEHSQTITPYQKNLLFDLAQRILIQSHLEMIYRKLAVEVLLVLAEDELFKLRVVTLFEELAKVGIKSTSDLAIEAILRK
ncbi:MAG: hypothetical protein ACW98K_07280 [Candidatus Kariarchaeaceae archaeon]